MAPGAWKGGMPWAREMRSVSSPAAVDLTFHPSLSAVTAAPSTIAMTISGSSGLSS